LHPFSLSSLPLLSLICLSFRRYPKNSWIYSKSIILVEDENTPEEISNYLKLTNF
jgi:hypothetical protein